MSKKKVIVGNTVGPPLPKSDLRETDPNKGSYVLGREMIGDLEKLKTKNKDSLVDAINEISEFTGTGGSGLNDAEKTLILHLFRNAAYTSASMGEALARLEEIWSGNTGGGSGGEQPNDGVVQVMSVLTITSGVTVAQTNDVLTIS